LRSRPCNRLSSGWLPELGSLGCANSSHPLHSMEALEAPPSSAEIRKGTLRGLHGS
jgi:hypothetical protein